MPVKIFRAKIEPYSKIKSTYKINFKACCDFVPIPVFCTCFRTSRYTRLGLRHTDSFPPDTHSNTPTQNGSSKNTVNFPDTLSMKIPP